MTESVSCSKVEEHLTIEEVDQARHTILLNVDGYSVTLMCSPQNNLKTYQQVRTILLDTIVNVRVQK